jgi:hypothetical protein
MVGSFALCTKVCGSEWAYTVTASKERAEAAVLGSAKKGVVVTIKEITSVEMAEKIEFQVEKLAKMSF